MKKSFNKLLILPILLMLLVTLLVSKEFINNKEKNKNTEVFYNVERNFLSQQLKTNTEIKSIDLLEILDGGPGKDGIPSIDNPKFVSVTESIEQGEQDENFGIKIEIGGEVKFYPYSILVWHEIVNDRINNKPILVTFCALCGSGIVYDPIVENDRLKFGVSGKLWQSNLLMYDDKTESLWSQSIGESVVGDLTSKKLKIIDSDLISFKEFREKYPEGKVLSRETGHTRNYNNYPYGDYDSNDRLYFPVSINDNRLEAKELMYIVNFEDKSVAFKRSDLLEIKEVNLDVNNKNINAKSVGGEIIITDDNGNNLAGYHEMWFSWATHHQENGIVWRLN